MKNYFTLTLFLLIGLIGFSQTGNVGVGNTTPVAKLDVSGDLALREGTAIAVAGANPAVTVSLHATNAENSFYRITGAPTGTMTLSSIANGVDGQIIALVNATSIKLNITDNNVANGIRTPTGSPVAIPTNGSVTLQYAATPTARWYITSASSGGVLPDWVKANTTNDPAGTLDSQYVNAKIGIGDFKNGASYGSNLEGWVTIKTPSDGTPSIVNPIKDAGIVIQGEGGTPSIKSRFRLVSNNNGWRDNKATAYLQISNNSNTNFDKSNLTLMSGSSGHDVNFNRFQINSDSTQITDYNYGATPRPSSIFEVISGQSTAKSIFHIKGIVSQTGNYMDISPDTSIINRGKVMTVLSTGNVGIGTATPGQKLEVDDPSSDAVYIRIKGAEAVGGYAGLEFSHQSTGNTTTKTAIVSVPYNSWKRSDLRFILNSDGNNNNYNIATDADTKMIIKNDGKVGIGTTSPLGPLSIGDASVTNSDGFLVIGKKVAAGTRQMRLGFDANFNFVIGDYGNNNTAGTWTSPFSVNYAAPDNSLNIISSGNVGIGMTPVTKLDVSGAIRASGGVRGASVGIGGYWSSVGNQIEADPGNDLLFGTGSSISTRMRIQNAGSVIIYNRLYVNNNGTGSGSGSTGCITLGDGTFSKTFGSGFMFSSSITASTTTSCSDARIKSIVGITNNEEDLEALTKIKITDYKYIDDIDYSNKLTKKVIAQQVQEVYSPAVFKLSVPKAIPNIYQKTTNFSIDKNTIKVCLGKEMNVDSNIIVGKICKFYVNNNDDEYRGKEFTGTIEEIDGQNLTIKTKESIEYNQYSQVFIYGTEVNDFLTVDYDAISMLNVSATQELAKRNATLECEVETLKAENAQLKTAKADVKDLEELKAQIEALKILILNTSLKAEK